MRTTKSLTHQQIARYQNQLLRFSQFDETTLRTLWPSSEEIITQAVHEEFLNYYHRPDYYLVPVMHQTAVKFFNMIDPCNQKRMMSYYGLYDRSLKTILDFFVWMGNCLPSQEISADKHLVFKTNEIQYYFELTIDQQNNLVTRYNQENERIRRLLEEDSI